MEKMSLFALIASDLHRYGGVGIRFLLTSYLLNPGFRYSFWYRVCSKLRVKSILFRPLYYILRIKLIRLSYKFGISIPPSASIGPGLYIGHFSGIVVSGYAVIGANCNISQGVTIGRTVRGNKPGCPVIHDRVYIAPGAKIIGGVTIGNDVAIGANAVVVHDLPDYSVAVGIPAKVISLNGSGSYVENTI